MQKISTCLWFNTNGEEAARFYVSIFPNSEIGHIATFPEAGKEIHGQKPGSVMTVEFTLSGTPYLALNGGPQFKFNEATSQIVNCDTQEEVDYFWEKLGAGGDPKARQCGWLKDKFGLSWQITPVIMSELMKGDPAQANRVMAAMMEMKKLDIAVLKKAARG